MKRKITLSFLILAVLLVVISVPALGQGILLGISDLKAGDVKSGIFEVNGTAVNDGTIDKIAVKVGSGPWETADGLNNWKFSINSRQIVLNTSYTYDSALGKLVWKYRRGPYYGDLNVTVGAFNASGVKLVEKKVTIKIIPEAPRSDLSSGTYDSPINVHFKAAPEVVIYYTKDGSDPKVSGTRLPYNGPIAISQDTVIKAVAKSDNNQYSEVSLLDLKISGGATLPSYTIQYYKDEGLTEPLPDPLYLKAGTYFLKILTNKKLSTVPTLSIDAQGSLNDVNQTSVVPISDCVYRYSRVIINDQNTNGDIQEKIYLTGTDINGNQLINEVPLNATLKAAYIDTQPPAVGSIMLEGNLSHTNDPTPYLLIDSTGADQMRLALSETGLATAVWVDYANRYDGFDISSGGNGQKTIWIEFKDQAGNIQTQHASTVVDFNNSVISFDIEYFSDPDLNQSLGANPVLGIGTYYLRIIINQDSATNPSIDIDAEGNNNDVSNGGTTKITTRVFYYTRTINGDIEAIGKDKELIHVSGIAPSNSNVNSAYTFTPQYTLTVINNGNGSTTPSGEIKVFDGISTLISAVPDINCYFVNWEKISGPGNIIFGNVNSPDTTVTITGGDATIRANFDMAQNILTVTDDGKGSTNISGAITVYAGAVTNIIATPNPGYHFVNWVKVAGDGSVVFGNPNSPNTTVILTNGDATIRANFAINQYNLTITNNGYGATSPSGVLTINHGSALSIIATPNPGYHFVNWEQTAGTGTTTFENSTSADTTVTVTGGNVTIRANFAINQYILTVNNDGHGSTNPSGNISVNHGANTNITATPNIGYQFKNWTQTAGSGTATFGDANVANTTVTVTGSDVTIQANFDPYILGAPVVTGPTITNNQRPKWSWDDVSGAVKYRYGFTEGDWIVEDATLTEYIPSYDLADGNHTLYVQVCISEENWSPSGTWSVIVDTTKPSVNAGIDVDWTRFETSINGTASDLNGITNILWEQIDGTGAVTFSSKNDLNTKIKGPVGTECSYTLRLTITDVAGNIAYDTMVFNWDSKAPVVEAGANIAWRKTSTILNGSVSDISPVTYEWTKDSGTGTVNFGNSNSLITEVSGLVGEEGSYILRLTATDAAGNTASDTLVFNWDSKAPVVEAGADIGWRKTSAILNGSVSDISPVTYEWTKDSGTGTVNFGNSNSLNTEVSGLVGEEGSYILRLTATDAAGNTASDTLVFNWDSKAPVVEAGSDIYWRNTITNLSGSVSDASPVNCVWSKISGWTVNFGDVNDLNSTVSGLFGEEGTYVLKLTATDAAGNTSYDTLVYNWDAKAPRVEAGPDIAWTNSITNLNGSVSDISPKTYLWEQIDGIGTVSFGNKNVLNTTINGPEGVESSYTLRLTVTDAVGNSSSDTLIFNWDKSIPNSPNLRAYNERKWFPQHALPTGNTLNSTYFIDKNTGWAVGNGGTILKTTDGGLSWVKIHSGLTNFFEAVYFVNANIGWIVGSEGIILKTTDGGINWTTQTSGTSNYLLDVYFYDINVGWTVGRYGTILKTTDGGINWSDHSLGTNDMLNTVCFLDANTGWIGGNNGKIIKTTDGGLNWITQTTGTTSSLFSVFFINSENGWAVGSRGTILSTINGGDDWSIQTTSVLETLTSVIFVNSNVGYIVADTGRILGTTDGGTNWIYQAGWTEDSLFSVYFIDTNTGWAVGSGGRILKTSNAGSNWVQQAGWMNESVNSIYFIDSNTGWAALSNGDILKTTDGGGNWVQVYNGIDELTTIFFYDSNTGWASARGRILKTTDGGLNWVTQYSASNYLYSIFFTDADNGWAVGSGPSYFKTTNGGTTWQPLSPGTTEHLNSVYFIDANIGWAVGTYGTIMKTTDGGMNWIPQNSGRYAELFSVHFENANIGWVVGNNGLILKTTDGGDTWITQSYLVYGSLKSVCFVDVNKGWAISESGTIIKTVDGGANWVKEESGCGGNLTSVCFVDENTGWAAGSGGMILKYRRIPIDTGYQLEDEGKITIEITGESGATFIKSVIKDGAPYPWPENNIFTDAGNYGISVSQKDKANNISPVTNFSFSIEPQYTIQYFSDADLTISLGKNPSLKEGTYYLQIISNRLLSQNPVISIDSEGSMNDVINGNTVLVSAGVYTYTRIIQNDSTACGSTKEIIAIDGIPPTNHDLHAAFIDFIAPDAPLVNGFNIVNWHNCTSPVSQNLNSVFFINNSKGWAAGDSGKIIVTMDGGKSWVAQESGIPNDLNSIFFINEDLGWVVGHYSYILNTTDGGTQWSQQIQSFSSLSSLYFLDEQNGWAVGSSSYGDMILKTSDGGVTWIDRSRSTSDDYRSVFFVNENVGWAVGSYGLIIKTTDGGNSWIVQNSGVSGPSSWLNSVYFVDSNTGWAVGLNGIVLKTTNGGDTWVKQSVGTFASFTSVYFLDANIGWAVGSNGEIIKTVDGGTNWTAEDSGTTNYLNSVQFVKVGNGWLGCAVGENGTILQSLKLPFNNNDVVNGKVLIEFINEFGAFLNKSVTKDGLAYPWPDQGLFSTPGNYIVNISQTDPAGNTSSNSTFSFTIE